MNNANKKIALISDYFNLYLITLFIIFIKPKLFSDYRYDIGDEIEVEVLDFNKIRKHLKLIYKKCHPELLKNDDGNEIQEKSPSLEKSLNTNYLINNK